MFPEDNLKRELDDMKGVLVAPDAALLHNEAARRSRVRRSRRAVGGVCAAAALIGSVSLYSTTGTEQVVVAAEGVSTTTVDRGSADFSTPVTTERRDESGPGEVSVNSEYVNLSVVDAGALAEANGLEWRIAVLDGVGQRGRANIVESRLNFFVADGLVVEALTDLELLERSLPPAQEESLVVTPEGSSFKPGGLFTVTAMESDEGVGAYTTLERWQDEVWVDVVSVLIAAEHLGEPRSIPLGEPWGTEDVEYGVTTYQLPEDLEPGSYRVCLAQTRTDCRVITVR